MKKSYHEGLKENVDIADQRVKYIKKLQEYRSEGRKIYFQDETWVNSNMTFPKAWFDEENSSEIASLPAGKGERSIICHIGSEDGFLEPAQLIFRGSKSLKDADYHSEMNAYVFQDWMKTKVLPNVPKDSVIVIDRATYHMTLTENTKPAPSTSKKQQFAEWLVEKKVKVKKMKTVDDFMSLKRVELAALCKKHKPKPKYMISEVAAKFKVKILILPVGHPEMNPIEMIWSMMKDFIMKRNPNRSLKEVEKLANEFFDNFDKVEWKKCVEHVKKIEEEYLEIADEIPVEM